MKTLTVVIGDTHTNSAVGLLVPGCLLDDGQEITLSASQKWLYEQWLQLWSLVDRLRDKYHPYVFTILNGDLCDMNAHSGFQLLEPVNPGVVIDMAAQTLRPAVLHSDALVVIRGTEAHTGGSGWLEETLAKRLGPRVRQCPETHTHSWHYYAGNVGGVHLVCAHHPGTNSMRPWTQGGGANRQAAMLQAAYYRDSWRPVLGIFNHVHHNEDSYDNHAVRVIFNRAFTLRGAYEHRRGFGIQRQSIGATLILSENGRYEVFKFERQLPRPEPQDIEQ